jgi:hypothetical protein
MAAHNATITDNECLERLRVFNGPGVTRRRVIELQYAKYQHAKKGRKQPETYEPTYDPSEEKPQVSQPVTLDVVINAMCRGIFLGKQ